MLSSVKHAATANAVTAECVFSDADLLECILCGNVGLRTYVAVRQLNQATRAICADNKTLLREAALHGGGLTKKHFVGLFSFNYQEGGRYPHTFKGKQHVFGADAIDQALARRYCMLLMRTNAVYSRFERDVYLRRRYGVAPTKHQLVVALKRLAG